MQAAPGSAEGDELDVLATLADAYEAKHHAIDAPDPISAIQFRMEQQGMTRRDLEQYIGSRARVSEIMTGRRLLTLPMIRRLRDDLGISADLLIAPASAPHRARSMKSASAKKHVGTKAIPEKNASPLLRVENLRKPRHASTGITHSG